MDGAPQGPEQLDPLAGAVKENDRMLRIYSHNISGGNGKIENMTNLLATTNYDLICLQETWYKDDVVDAELVNGTPFNLYRADRANFSNQKKKGGGLIILVRENIDAEVLNVIAQGTRTQLEYLCLRIGVGSEQLILLNVYSATYRKSFRLQDLSKVMFGMKEHGDIPWLVLGDFNHTGIKWKCADEAIGTLSVVEEQFNDDNRLSTPSIVTH